MTRQKRLFILDANGLLHRAWHALPPLTSPSGMIVNAVYGVMMTVIKILQDEQPDAFVACWDTKAPTFRHLDYEAYKATREKQEDALYEQIPALKEGLDLLGIDSLALDGYEADDLIGTLAIQAKSSGWDVTILTGDRDTLQLVQPSIRVLAFKKGVTEMILFDEAEIQRQYGLTPKQFLEFKAMRGDPSDNIPGIKGIGEKTATNLLQKYQTLDRIMHAAHEHASDLTASVRQKLLDAEKEVPALRRLVTIVTDVPIKWMVHVLPLDALQSPALRTWLLSYGFKTLAARLETKAEILPTQEKPKAADFPVKEAIITERCVAMSVKDLSPFTKSGEIVLWIAGDIRQPSLDGSDGMILLAACGALLIPFRLLKKDKAIRSAFMSLLTDPRVGKITHDAKQVLFQLAKEEMTVEPWIFDTLLAAYLLGAGERNHDLPSIAGRYAGLAVQEGSSGWEKAQAIFTLAPLLRAMLDTESQTRIFTDCELPLIPVLRAMEQEGILIDRTYLRELAEDMRTNRQTLHRAMTDMVGQEFNPGSPVQLAHILFEVLQLPVKGIKRGKTGISTAAAELEKLRGTHGIIEKIEEYREVSKLLSTYVETLPEQADTDGRVHTTYNQAVTATGRLSSSDPNLQNIPTRTETGKKIRRAFITKPGYVLVSCDYSQIELRLVAALAKDARMLDAFRQGEDIHRATAAAIWNKKPADVTKEERRAAKAINFGIIYGQGPQGLAQSAGISFQEAKQFIDAYFHVYQGVRRYMDETREKARKLGYIETLFGRRRPLPEIHAHMQQVRAQAERMAINMPVQGTAADLMKFAMIDVYKKLPSISRHARMLLQVHDELVLEAPKKEADHVAQAVKTIMERVKDVGVPIVVDVAFGANWAELG